MAKYNKDSLKPLLDSIPDKRVDKNTTSLKFKEDLISFFSNKNLESCLEIGTNLGWTTRILSNIFKEVHTIEVSSLLVERAKENNKDSTNIKFYNIDATKRWNISKDTFDVIFIDCIHTKAAVIEDIRQGLEYFPKYLVFDDYGLPEKTPAVKDAVLDFIEANEEHSIEITYIGEPSGSEPRIGRKLIDWEGVILSV